MKTDPANRPEWISLHYAAYCAATKTEPHNEKPFEVLGYPTIPESSESSEILKKFLVAGYEGQIAGRGEYSKLMVRQIMPDDFCIPSSEDMESDLRSKEKFILDRIATGIKIEIPTYNWQKFGLIYERNVVVLWGWPDWRDTRIPQEPLSTYDETLQGIEMAELVCFSKVEINTEKFINWQREIGKKHPNNDRNAGVKSKVDWEKVEDFLQEAIGNGKTWVGQGSVHGYVIDELGAGSGEISQDGFFKYLRKKKELWKILKPAIQSSKFQDP